MGDHDRHAVPNMIPHDYHMHSLFSGDNDSPMEAMCAAAVHREIPEICFTEHFDMRIEALRRIRYQLEAWLAELDRCRALFEGKLVIRSGLEVSEPHLTREELSKLLGRHPFDLVIGSLHWLGEYAVFDPRYFQRPMDEGYTTYFEELERMTRAGGFDVVGHFDIVARFGHEIYGEYEPSRYEPIIRRSLQNCIDRGIGLDVNAGCLRRKLGRTNPDVEILRWYAEMGGTRLVLSSDAHSPVDVGSHLEKAVEIVQSVGLTEYVSYEQRVPCSHGFTP